MNLSCIKAKRVARCRDARSERPLYQSLQHRGFNGDGRSDRASLLRVTREIFDGGSTHIVEDCYICP